MDAHPRNAFDVVVAGGGVAGIAVTVALSEFGYRVLIVEPGMDHSRRLAGELIHPPGVTDLACLGLLEPMKSCGGVPVWGFAVFPDSDGHRAFHLGYPEVPGLLKEGYAAAHGALTDRLLREVEQLPRVTVWKGARVVGLTADSKRSIAVAVRGPGGETQVAPQLLIAADGANSQVRRMAGIKVRCRRVSRMVSYTISSADLPAPGFGNVFLGAPAPVLACQIGARTTRVMFDLPANASGSNLIETLHPHLEALPEPFDAEVKEAIETQKPLTATTYSVVTETVYMGRILCVGDAAGCCHPLSATGLSVCTRDAVRLRDSIRAAKGDLGIALREYARARRRPQRSRAALASIIYDVFGARTPHMRLLREGMLRYWERSAHGRAAGMAQLSLSEDRMTRMAWEYSAASWFAFREMCRSDRGSSSVKSAPRAMLGLSISTFHYLTDALKDLIL